MSFKSPWGPAGPAPAVPDIPGFPLIRGDQIVPTKVEWLWYPYIPRAKLTSLEGHPGLGKSFIGCSIAAAVTASKLLPGMNDPLLPNNVLFLSGEDGLEDTLVPRLLALGADMNRIYFPKIIVTLDPKGILALEEAMRQCAVAFVFIDPVQLFMGSKRDMNKANEVREFIAGLHEASARCQCTTVIIRHQRKAGGDILMRGLGSMDFIAGCRSGLAVYRTKSGRTYMEHIKHNLSVKGPTIPYGIDNGVFYWDEPVKGILSEDAEPETLCDKAAVFLKDYLRDGPKPMKECVEKGNELGLTFRTLERAKRRVADSIKSTNAWFWKLQPEFAAEAPAGSNGSNGALDPLEGLDGLVEEARRRMGDHLEH